jgi:curved DNA-binding protein CbpA
VRVSFRIPVTVRIPRTISKPHPALDLSDDDLLVLKGVDGLRSPEQIADLCKLSIQTVATSLVRLTDLFIIDLGEQTAQLRPEGSTARKRISIAPKTGAHLSAAPTAGPRASIPPIDDTNLDLTEEQKATVERVYTSLSDTTHYALLGIEQEADRKAVKRAYYAEAAAFHPDRFFRKSLGSYKAKMEQVFAYLTEAHDVLSDRARRADYDAYLATLETTASLEAKLVRGAARAEAAKSEAARARGEVEARIAEALEQAARAAMVSIPATPLPASIPPLVATSEALRKAALAQRLLAGRKPMRPEAAAAATEVKIQAKPSAAEAVEALKRRYEAVFLQSRDNKERDQHAVAEQCLAVGDLVGSVNAYRTLTMISPSNASYQAKLADLEHQMTVTLHAQYKKQAEYEESAGKAEDALKSWSKAVAAIPSDPETNTRTALALVKCRSDLHAAAEFAKKAILLEPKAPQHHVALARVYLEAQLIPAARVSVENALNLAPGDPKALLLKKRILTDHPS